MGKKQTFFSAAEEELITNTIQAVEKDTAGEVAVMLVEASDSYPESRIIGGILIGSAAALLVSDLLFSASLPVFISLSLVLSIVSSYLLGLFPAACRLFHLPAMVEERVRNRALAAFYEQGLHHTRDETGVLFFISILERKVWVLADRGIYEKISQDQLSNHAELVAAGMRKGHAADALCREISRVGELLARHFPPRPDDENELTDGVIHG